MILEYFVTASFNTSFFDFFVLHNKNIAELHSSQQFMYKKEQLNSVLSVKTRTQVMTQFNPLTLILLTWSIG
jgi:hypothetical protein